MNLKMNQFSQKNASLFEPKLLIGVLLSLSCLVVPTWAIVGGWQFSWSDEFNGPSVDTSVWGYETGYSIRNQELENYTTRPDNSRIDNGCLLIQALRDNYNGHPYSSASRRTMNRKSWLYGKFEMRAQIDVRLGSWPAWWWLPNTGGWPKGGEIDMMEFYQGKCLFNVMDGSGKWQSPTRTVASLGGNLWADNFHVWTWVWDSTKIDLSLDTTLINHYPLSNADGTGPGGANPFRSPGYMLVNQAIGGINGGDPSSTTFPINYRIDWIRVHTWSNVAAYTLTVNGGIGSGPYVPGTKASIVALMPPAGQVFDKWVISSGAPAIDSQNAASAILTMPASDASITATYKSSGNIVIYSVGQLSDVTQKFRGGTLDIFSVSGALVKKVSATDVSENNKVLASLSSGIYFFRVSDKLSKNPRHLSGTLLWRGK
jgi:beta-glucanase (GH16 family)